MLFSAPAFPWSKEGHQTIADIALPLLNDQAKAAITQILGSETLADAAEWPDAIKPPYGSLCGTPEAKAFNHAHGDNKRWHYVKVAENCPKLPDVVLFNPLALPVTLTAIT